MTITTETFSLVDVGTSPNDGTGDDLRTAFQKINSNFDFVSGVGFNAANIKVSNEIETQQATINGNLFIKGDYVPESNNSLGQAGQLAWDSGNIYICVAANTWVKATLTSDF
jgi:hypothetical protein